MALPPLNSNGPQYSEARGITPPLMRGMCHVGYAVAVANTTPDDEWEETFRKMAIEEVEEARRHLHYSDESGFDPSPFLSPQALRHVGEIYQRTSEVVVLLQEASKADAYEYLTTLANDFAYISAVAENYVTGDVADEGRNP